MVILADQAKTNTTGRVDEHGLFRHRHVELCGYGAVALHLFSHFHIVGQKPPDFTPDFLDPNHTEFGRQDWYRMHLFPGKGRDGCTPMTYASKRIFLACTCSIADSWKSLDHNERLKAMHDKNGVSISKVTHGGRFYAADKAGQHGANGMDIKALGNWKTGDAYSEIYNRALPVKAMLASAMFNPEKADQYVLPRSQLCEFWSLSRMSRN